MHSSPLPSLPSLTASAAFLALQDHCAEAKNWHIRDLFASAPTRFETMSMQAAGLFLDYSKNRLNQKTLQLLCNLARERQVEAKRDAMFAGEKINLTEHRAVLHTALRAPRHHAFVLDGQDISHDVHAVLDQIKAFSEKVRSGAWRGYSGKAITDIVNIGIGGSDLGPKMAHSALREFAHPALNFHFVSNIDGHDVDATLAKVDPETTLFIIASKTFTTQDTMLNAHSARNWFLRHADGDVSKLAQHFVAISSNQVEIQRFGIDPNNMFVFWDWVGGRYSVWSAIGLSIAIMIGFEAFSEFLAGAHAMDVHFQTAPLESNMPVLLALIGLWNRNFLGYASLFVAPYHQDLRRLPAYLQQLEMESNGKSIANDGRRVNYPTCPILWGEAGSNNQHAYFQLLHQGGDIIPVDFIAVLKPSHHLPQHHTALLANCFAQSEAFMRGKNAQEVHDELQQQGVSEQEISKFLPHKIFAGNRPSNTLLMDALTPTTLGALLALYEHKTMVQGVLWNINSFDQYGVELGKQLARNIQTELEAEAHTERHDSSTNGLIARAKASLNTL